MVKIYQRSQDIINKRATELKGYLSDGFYASLDKAYNKYTQFMSEGRKKELKFCYISYLRSSVVERRPLFRIDLYDVQGICDLVECEAEWDISKLSNKIYEDIPYNKNPIKGIGLEDYAIEQFWLEETAKYIHTIGSILPDILLLKPEYMKNVVFYYGEFLDQTVTL